MSQHVGLECREAGDHWERGLHVDTLGQRHGQGQGLFVVEVLLAGGGGGGGGGLFPVSAEEGAGDRSPWLAPLLSCRRRPDRHLAGRVLPGALHSGDGQLSGAETLLWSHRVLLVGREEGEIVLGGENLVGELLQLVVLFVRSVDVPVSVGRWVVIVVMMLVVMVVMVVREISPAGLAHIQH